MGRIVSQSATTRAVKRTSNCDLKCYLTGAEQHNSARAANKVLLLHRWLVQRVRVLHWIKLVHVVWHLTVGRLILSISWLVLSVGRLILPVGWLILASLKSHLVVVREVWVTHVLLLLVLVLLHLVHHVLVHLHEVRRRGRRWRPVAHGTHMWRRWRRHLAVGAAERHHLLALVGVHGLLHDSTARTRI